jgi:carboxyl-terminal processing protease
MEGSRAIERSRQGRKDRDVMPKQKTGSSSLKRKIVISVAIGTTTFLILLAVLTYIGYRRLHMRPIEKFNLVWSTVRDHYYDPHFNGYDWVAVRDRFAKRVPEDDPREFVTGQIIDDMLSLLEVSHLNYEPTWEARPAITGVKSNSPASLPLAVNLFGGLHIDDPTLPVRPVLQRLDASSFLARHGVKPGLPLALDIVEERQDKADSTIVRKLAYEITLPDGSVRELIADLPLANPDRPLPYIDYADKRIVVDRIDQASFERLHRLLLEPAASLLPVVYPALGVTLSHGRDSRPPRVTDVTKDSSAAKAGVEPGSLVEAMHCSSAAASASLCHMELKLPDGRVMSANLPLFDVSLHAHADEDNVSAVMEGPVLVLRFNTFDRASATWLMAQLRARHPEKVILDLRHNHGGDVVALQTILAQFLPAGATIASTQDATGRSKRLTVPSGSILSAARLAVLIGPGSASAAEVTAAALQYHGRAKLIGMTTSGKVMESMLFHYPDGSQVKIATSALQDPSGRTLEGQGVLPDVARQNTLADIQQERDVPMTCALSIMNDVPCPEPPSPPPHHKTTPATPP